VTEVATRVQCWFTSRLPSGMAALLFGMGSIQCLVACGEKGREGGGSGGRGGKPEEEMGSVGKRQGNLP
jgi:hypothetical protein